MVELYIKDLIVEGKHGLHIQEQQTPQPFRISVALTMDRLKATQTDDLIDTLDWSTLKQEIIAIVQDKSFTLIERLAQVIAEAMLAHDGVKAATVSVDKITAFESGYPGIRLSLAAD